MSFKNITPPRYACAIGSCPGVFKRSNGKYFIQGAVLLGNGNVSKRLEKMVEFNPNMVLAALKAEGFEFPEG